MKLLLVTFMTIATTSFAQTSYQETIESIPGIEQFQKNTSIKHSTNFQEIANGTLKFDRTVDFPTQVIRIQGDVRQLKKKCEEVHAEMDEFYTSKLSSDKFYYNTIAYCGYDPTTELATQYSIFSYFDPMDNEAVQYAKKYISEHNGKPVLGLPFVMESASGLVVSLNIDAGFTTDPYAIILIRFRSENETHYFANDYEMLKELTTDIYARFYSNESQVILPFLNRWFPLTGGSFMTELGRSNYVLLRPERIFIMNEAPHAFTSPLRMYFAHHCEKYKNKMCL